MSDALATLAIRVAGAGIAFGLQVLLARIMTVGDYGIYAMVWTWLLSLGSFASLGLAEAAVKLLPRYAVRMRTQAIESYFSFGLHKTAVAAGVVSLIAMMLAMLIPMTNDHRTILLGVAVGLPFLALEFFLEGVARAMGWYRLTTIAVYIIRPVLLAVLMATLFSTGFAITAALVIAVLTACIAATTLGLYGIMRKRLASASGAVLSRVEKFWGRQSRPLLLVSGLDDVLSYADVVLVGLLLDPAQSALYFVASRVLTLANLVQHAFFFIAGRGFSAALAQGRLGEARSQMWRATGVTVATTALAVGVTLFAAPLLLELFGNSYADNMKVIMILGVAIVARSFALQATEFMLVSGHVRSLVVVNSATVVLLVAAMLAFVPGAGVSAAAAAMAVAMAFRTIALLALQLQTEQATTSQQP